MNKLSLSDEAISIAVRDFLKLRIILGVKLVLTNFIRKTICQISDVLHEILHQIIFISPKRVGWLVGVGFNGPLRQYFSLYRAISQREGERGKRIDESKNVQTTPTCTYCKCSRPLPWHWKFTQHHRTTRPLPHQKGSKSLSIPSCEEKRSVK